MRDREEFEKWAINYRGEYDLPHFILKDDSGEYIDGTTRIAWQAWQAVNAQNGGQAVAWMNQRGDAITDEEKQRFVNNQGIVGAAVATNYKIPLYPSASVPDDKQFWPAIESFVDDFIDGYELRGDEGDYTPNERERFLIEDCVAGLLHDMDQEGWLPLSPNGATPQPADSWIKCSDKLPIDEDEDCEGKIWCGYNDKITRRVAGPWLKSVREFLVFAHQYPESNFWMPTNLKRPAPPEQGANK